LGAVLTSALPPSGYKEMGQVVKQGVKEGQGEWRRMIGVRTTVGVDSRGRSFELFLSFILECIASETYKELNGESTDLG